jgi:hypothetical protein
LNGLLANGVPKIWDDAPDMDELTVFIKHVTPEELVAIAQSVYDSREIVGQRIGMVQHILRLEKYYGKLFTINSYDFCKCLYMAHGYRMLMMSGKEDFRELPTIDNLDCEFRNACFDVYIKLRAEQIMLEQKHNNRRLYPPKLEDCYAQLADELEKQYNELSPIIEEGVPSFLARESLLIAMQFLARYAKDKQDAIFASNNQIQKQGTTIVNVNAPVGQFIANVEQMNTTKD